VLHAAAQNGRDEVVQTLLKSNASIHEKSNNGWTALHFAAENGHNEVVQTLLKSNAECELPVGACCRSADEPSPS
jgi:ankyrin repeat protein